MDLEKLTQEERIDLFDRLLEDRTSTWRVRDVVGLSARRGKSADVEHLEEGDVRALSAAILSGSSLRRARSQKGGQDRMKLRQSLDM